MKAWLNEDFGPHLKHILSQMCKAVGASPAGIDFKADRWFMEYEWTREQERAFIKWLTKYLYNSKGARQEILETNWKNLKHCRKAAEFFVWNHGWKYTEQT